MNRIVIVGAGLAGLTAAQELRRLGFHGSLVLIGAEPHHPYRRPPLSKEYLTGAEPEIGLPGVTELDATWLLGAPATGLDLHRRRVLRGSLAPVGFDGLVIATGVRPRPLAVPGGGLAGVVTLRGLDDARLLRRQLAQRPKVVVAGAGFIGSEVAATVRGLGLTVALVSRDQMPLRRQLGEQVGGMVADMHRQRGVDLRMGRRISAVSGAGRVERVHLDDGSAIDADLLVVALGADPEVSWLDGAGLATRDGVAVRHDGLVAPGIAVAGDVARWRHPILGREPVRIEHYTNAAEQGAHAARALLGAAGRVAPVPSFWSHLYESRLQAIGFTGHRFESRMVSADRDGRFVAEYRWAGRVVGAATVGMVRMLAGYRARIAAQLR